MTEIHGLFETHLTVGDLDRSIRFYRDQLGLSVAAILPERQAAFFWVGPGKSAMLGLWANGHGPQRMSLHTAFRTSVESVITSLETLRNAGIAPLDFDDQPAEEAVVLAWMPAVAVYFRDPDGNLLEYIAMLPQGPRPELGVIKWREWSAESGL
jgi:lactoylglutathione lyase